jgi:hypothetical protein
VHVFRDHSACDAATFYTAREGVYLAVLGDELEFNFIATQSGTQHGVVLSATGENPANVLKGLTHAHAHGPALQPGHHPIALNLRWNHPKVTL